MLYIVLLCIVRDVKRVYIQDLMKHTHLQKKDEKDAGQSIEAPSSRKT